MKVEFNDNIKQVAWNILKEITNNFSHLKVKHLGNGQIKCQWNISSLDNFKINFSNSCFYAIRLFDISNNRNKNNSTCIMKEIQVNKFQSSISFPIPIEKGVYHFEFGYRKRNGQWRILATQDLNLGYRIKKAFRYLEQENWFSAKLDKENSLSIPHEVAYQLSFHSEIGGSENITSK